MSSNRSFGLVFCIFFLVVALYPLIHDGSIRLWSLIISIIFLILGLINSKLLLLIVLTQGSAVAPFIYTIF